MVNIQLFWGILLASLLLLGGIISSHAFIKWTKEQVYPLCHHYHDNDGLWLQINNITTEEDQREVNRHFFLHGPGEALDFSQIWIPKGCSYHRFTNESFYRMIDDILESPDYNGLFPQNTVHIALVGNSAMRGVFCGITRILSGSEVNGPCDKIVCKENTTQAQTIQFYEMPFSPRFKITFVVMDDCNKQRNQQFREKLTKRFFSSDTINRPYAMVINRDLLWNFDQNDRNRIIAAETESQSEDRKLTKSLSEPLRSSRNILLKMKYFSDLAKRYQVRLISRNNYLPSNNWKEPKDNSLSFDGLFEQKVKSSIPNSIWEFWDNRGLLQSLKNTLTLDLPREIEIQVAQSLLNGLFYDYLVAKYDQVYPFQAKDVSSENKNPLAEGVNIVMKNPFMADKEKESSDDDLI